MAAISALPTNNKYASKSLAERLIILLLVIGLDQITSNFNR